jgi:DNA-binding transcriptional ArsR family regulator
MDVYEALADPTRRQIIAMLAGGERTAGHISARFDMAAPSVSRHLKVLRESGLIAYRQEAQSRLYRLEPQRLEEARRWMDDQLRQVNARFDRLAEHLDHMKDRGD